jgi:hypothetical protein
VTNSKLIQLLKTFTTGEFKSLGKFVSSSYFCKDKAVIMLYDSLKKYYPRFNNKNLTKELIFNEIYPGRKYNDSHVKYLMSGMFTLGKKFLVYSNYGNDTFSFQYSVLNEFNKRNLYKFFESDFKLLNDELASKKQANAEYYNRMFSLKKMQIEQQVNTDRQKQTGQHIIEEGKLNVFTFITRFFTQYFEMLVNKNDSDVDYTHSVIDEFYKNLDLENFMRYLEKTKNEEYPVIALYYNLMMAYKNYDDDAYYYNFRRLLKENLHLLDPKQQFDMYTALASSCILKGKRGKKGFTQELFNIQKEMLLLDLYTLKGQKYFEVVHFRNILLTASNLKQYEWIKKFVKENKEKLNSEHRDDVVNFCYGYLNFRLKNFGKSLEFLQNVRFDQFDLDIKHLIIKIHYELDYIDLFTNLMDSYKHFLNNNKTVSDYNKLRHSNFLTLLNKIYKLKLKGIKNKDEIKFLKDEITKTEPVNSQQWLVEKANEI